MDVDLCTSRSYYNTTHSNEICTLFGLVPLTRIQSAYFSIHVTKEHARNMECIAQLLKAHGIDGLIVDQIIADASKLSRDMPDNDEYHANLVRSITQSVKRFSSNGALSLDTPSAQLPSGRSSLESLANNESLMSFRIAPLATLSIVFESVGPNKHSPATSATQPCVAAVQPVSLSVTSACRSSRPSRLRALGAALCRRCCCGAVYFRD